MMDKVSILIVEDPNGTTEQLVTVLRQLGYTAVETVQTEAAAHRQAAANSPDLLFTSIDLARLSDSRQIGHLDDVTVVRLVNRDDFALENVLEKGQTEFLITPFSRRELEITLELALYRRKMERKLRESEARFEDMLQMASDAIISIDEQQRIQRFNQGAENVFGYQAAEVLGRQLNLLLPAELVGRHQHHFQAFRNSPERARSMAERHLEISGQRRDGTSFPAEVSISKLTEHGQISYTAILRDITKRKQMEDELRLILSVTQEISVAPDFPTAISRTLAAVCQAMEWDYGEAWFSLVDEQELVCFPQWYVGRPELEQFRQLSAELSLPLGAGLPGKAWSSGRPEWVADMSQAWPANFPRATMVSHAGLKTGCAIPIATDDGGTVVLAFFSTKAKAADKWLLELASRLGFQIGDGLQKKQVEERLRKLSSVVEHTADTVIITNTEGVIEYVNPAFVQLTGYTEAEAVGRTPRILKSGKHGNEFYATLWETLYTGQAFHASFVNRKKHGELYYEEKTITPLRNTEGNMTHFVATGKDITERQRLEDRIAAIYRLGQELTLIRDEEVIVERVLKTSAKLLRIKDAACGLVSETNHELIYSHCLTGGKIVANNLRLLLDDPQHTGTIVAQRREAINLPDTAQEPQTLAFLLDLAKGSELCVPIKVGRRVLGVLHVFGARTNQFKLADQQLLRTLADQAAVTLENAWLFRHVQQRNLELNRLDNALETLFPSTLAGVENLAQTMVEIILREFDQSNCSLVLVEQGSNRLARLAVAGPFSEQVSQRQLTLDGPGLVALAIRSGKMLNVPDVRLHPAYLPTWKEALSELTIPLKIGPMVIGAIDVQGTRLAAFGPEDERLLSVFAERAALALENSRLYAETRQRARELAILNKVGQEMASSLDLNTVLNQIMDEIKGLFEAEAASVLLRDVESNELVFSAVASPASEALMGIRLPITQGIAGWVVREMRPLLVNNARNDPRFYVNIDNMTGMTTSSLLAVPLIYNEAVTGVIEVVNRISGVFDQQNLEMLEALASSAAIAIENARLFNMEQEQYRRLQESQAQLIQAEKLGALGRLVASIAHEINNPLQSMQGCLALTQEELKGERRQEKLDQYLSIVDGETERIATIVQRMRDFYRPAQWEQRHTDLHAVLHDVLALINKQLQHSQVVVERQWADDLPTILANPDHLKQVFLNLALNSIDALPAGGTLVISSSRDQILGHGAQKPRPAVRIEFRDNGMGMSAETVSHLFEPFFTTKASGSGLGLSVSYGIIEAHEGKISVASELGSGTTFTIWLPSRYNNCGNERF